MHTYTQRMCVHRSVYMLIVPREGRGSIDQKSREVAGERGMSQRDLLLDGDSPLRVELQLQPSVSVLERGHTLYDM